MTTISANIFASKEYALLSWLAERQTDTRDGPVVPFSQNDLVQELQCSPVTINKWMKSLCDSGCLTPYKKEAIPHHQCRSSRNCRYARNR